MICITFIRCLCETSVPIPGVFSASLSIFSFHLQFVVFIHQIIHSSLEVNRSEITSWDSLMLLLLMLLLLLLLSTHGNYQLTAGPFY